MFWFRRKRCKVNTGTAKALPAAQQPPSNWQLTHVDKPPATTETFVVSKTVPAVTYMTRYETTTFPGETYHYVTPARHVTRPVGNTVTVHSPSSDSPSTAPGAPPSIHHPTSKELPKEPFGSLQVTPLETASPENRAVCNLEHHLSPGRSGAYAGVKNAGLHEYSPQPLIANGYHVESPTFLSKQITAPNYLTVIGSTCPKDLSSCPQPVLCGNVAVPYQLHQPHGLFRHHHCYRQYHAVRPACYDTCLGRSPPLSSLQHPYCPRIH